MSLAPIVLFVYNRPWHTEQTLMALANNLLAGHSDLIIYSDGAKSEAVADAVKEVRKIISAVSGFKSVQIVERQENWGLSKSVISGVSEIVDKYSKIIVLEDDHVTSPYFLQFMNDALELYKNEPEVISIHGYVYPVAKKLPDYFFLKGADCWGWATWKRGWALFEENGTVLLQKLLEQNLTTEFDFSNTYPYTQMLQEQIEGKNSSWAIRWYASAFLQNKFTLYPGRSLIRNIGLDKSGTHSKNTNHFDTIIQPNQLELKKIEVKENFEAKNAIQDYFDSIKPNFVNRAIQKIIQHIK